MMRIVGRPARLGDQKSIGRMVVRTARGTRETSCVQDSRRIAVVHVPST